MNIKGNYERATKYHDISSNILNKEGMRTLCGKAFDNDLTWVRVNKGPLLELRRFMISNSSELCVKDSDLQPQNTASEETGDQP